jgi:hypothetical protein
MVSSSLNDGKSNFIRAPGAAAQSRNLETCGLGGVALCHGMTATAIRGPGVAGGGRRCSAGPRARPRAIEPNWPNVSACIGICFFENAKIRHLSRKAVWRSDTRCREPGQFAPRTLRQLPIKQTSSAWHGLCGALIGIPASGAHRSIAHEAFIPMSPARGDALSRSRPRLSTSFGSQPARRADICWIQGRHLFGGECKQPRKRQNRRWQHCRRAGSDVPGSSKRREQ